jgi:uncharacterized membrane protein YozB (DUF420 family)
MITEPIKSSRTGEFVSRLGTIAAAGALLALAIPTGLIALTQGAGLMPLPFNLQVVVERLPGIFQVHMLASGAALLLMPLAIATRRRRAWHRPIGRAAALLVIAGAVTSFPVAYESTSSVVARLGFAAQGTVWLTLLIAGVSAIRRKDRARHATLMLAMTAVASGAIWVRLTTAVATSYDLPFVPVYACATWLGWIVPLAAVLVATRVRSGSAAQSHPALA